MKAASAQPLELMEQLAIAAARQQRDRYLQQFDALLASLEDTPPSPPETMRALFADYDAPDSSSLSAAIETMREAR